MPQWVLRYLLNPQDFGNLMLLIILMFMCAQDTLDKSGKPFNRTVDLKASSHHHCMHSAVR